MNANQIISIVEGDGEVDAFPHLVQQLLKKRGVNGFVVPRAKNSHGGSNLKKEGGLERFVRYAWMEKKCAGVLVLIDGDDSDWPCAKKLAVSLAARVAKLGALKPTAVIVATQEYEAWFLASADTITSQCSLFLKTVAFDGEPESKRGAKQWLAAAMPKGSTYKETEHQLMFTRLISIEKASKRCRSFRRLESAIGEVVSAVRTGKKLASPSE